MTLVHSFGILWIKPCENAIYIKEGYVTMKRISMLLLVVIWLTACFTKPGSVENVKIDLGTSSKFSQDELESAADSVLKKFPDFEDCILTDLWYDEEVSNREVATFHKTKDDPNNSIILLSNFDVGPGGYDGGFSPNSTYPDWKWTLTRNGVDGKWEVIGWGYA